MMLAAAVSTSRLFKWIRVNNRGRDIYWCIPFKKSANNKKCYTDTNLLVKNKCNYADYFKIFIGSNLA